MVDLSPVQQKFILHWGEMGTRWGINRTVAQIHALLYIWPDPLNADDIRLTLSVARSNVSNSLKELNGWGLLKTVQKLGDRKDHFGTLEDPWEMFRIVGNERKRREMDPTVVMLAECLEEQKNAQNADFKTQFFLLIKRHKTPSLLIAASFLLMTLIITFFYKIKFLFKKINFSTLL